MPVLSVTIVGPLASVGQLPRGGPFLVLRYFFKNTQSYVQCISPEYINFFFIKVFLASPDVQENYVRIKSVFVFWPFSRFLDLGVLNCSHSEIKQLKLVCGSLLFKVAGKCAEIDFSFVSNLLVNCSQTKFVAIILVLSVFFMQFFA